ncbi:WxL protein peptidoglycan domain-containing protein [Compostimonas suwonensis]|nr:DUF916 domain-containing protein [Compostimonas suwonensis]
MTAVAALAAALSGLAATPALAADGEITWSVQPSSPTGPDGRNEFDYTVAPGSTITDYVSVTNFSATPITFRVYAADAITDYDTGSFTLIGADQASSDTGSWTSIDNGAASCADTSTEQLEAACAAGLGVSVTLEPNSRADLPFTITVPADATPGDHSAGIVAAYQKTDAATDGSAVNVSQRVGTRIYLRVDGPLEPGLTVAGLVSGYDSGWNPFGAGTASVGFDLTNSGNTRLSATPTATLTGPFGIPLGTLTAPEVRNLLPGQAAHVVAEASGIPPLLLLFADVTVAPVPSDGKASGDPLPAAVAGNTTAWAVPWALVGLLALIAAIIVGIVWYRRRTRERLAVAIGVYAEQVRREALDSAGDAPDADHEPVTLSQR